MGKIVSILSGKGGTGKTITSINLSLALRTFNQKVVLIDGNISMPHISTYLGINSWKYTLNDFLSGKDFKREALVNYNGIKLLISSPDLKDLVNIDLKKLRRVVENIKEEEKPDFIIIDGPPGIGKETISIIEVSNEILVVIQPFEQNIIDAIKIKEIAESLNKIKIKVILNNGFWLHKKKIEEMEKILRMEVIGFVPNNKSLMFSLVNKLPILEEKPNSLIAEMFKEIAAKLCEEEYKESWKFKLFKSFNDLVSYF
ncbi:MAG: P-loop NTPase [Candidatus Aenigmatarchaeota archaeon]